MVSRDIIDIREIREINEIRDISEISEISEDAIGLGFVVSLWLTSPKVRMLRLEGVSEYHNRTYA